MAYIRIVDERFSSHSSTSKEWTQWHNDLYRLVKIIQSVVEEDHEKRQSARKSGRAKDATLE
jgi:hypothetical protein